MVRLKHPTRDEIVDIVSPARVEVLLSRGYTRVEDEPAAKRPRKTARVLPVNPPDEPEE